MKGGADPRDVLGFHPGVGGIDLARLTRSQVDNRMRDDRHDHQQNDALQDVSDYEGPHCRLTLPQFPSPSPLPNGARAREVTLHVFIGSQE